MCQTPTPDAVTIAKPIDRKLKNQGMNWIPKPKRLAIYLRDGLACAYCGSTLEDGAILSLDHLKPYSQGGGNEATNLITCCKKCNSSRGNRSVKDFAEATATYLDHGVTASEIIEHVADCITRPLDVPAAKELIARRGWFVRAK